MIVAAPQKHELFTIAHSNHDLPVFSFSPLSPVFAHL